jgi:hypothetical protein
VARVAAVVEIEPLRATAVASYGRGSHAPSATPTEKDAPRKLPEPAPVGRRPLIIPNRLPRGVHPLARYNPPESKVLTASERSGPDSDFVPLGSMITAMLLPSEFRG